MSSLTFHMYVYVWKTLYEKNYPSYPDGQTGNPGTNCNQKCKWVKRGSLVAFEDASKVVSESFRHEGVNERIERRVGVINVEEKVAL